MLILAFSSLVSWVRRACLAGEKKNRLSCHYCSGRAGQNRPAARGAGILLPAVPDRRDDSGALRRSPPGHAPRCPSDVSRRWNGGRERGIGEAIEGMVGTGVEGGGGPQIEADGGS